MPIAANCHGFTAAKIPWLAADAARMPSRKAPLTLTTVVPQGNVSPTRRATKPDSQYLAVPPIMLPRATHVTPLMVSTACLDLLSGYSLLKPYAGTFAIFIFSAASSLAPSSFVCSDLHFPCQRSRANEKTLASRAP